MTTQDVANRLIELCRTGKWDEAQNELYADNAVSLEPVGSRMEKTEGMASIKEKGKHWAEMVEAFHGSEISEPIVAGSHFAVTMTMDITYKGAPRKKDGQLAVYEVKEGKIVKEQFFYPLPPSS